MADGRADLAVHSLKDVPMDMPRRASRSRRSRRARTRATRSSRNRHASLADAARGRGASAPRACAAKRSCASAIPRSRSSRCAATSTRACASSTRATTTRSSSRPPALKRLGLRRPHRVAARSGRQPARAGTGRAGDRMPQRPPRPSPALAPLADRATTLADHRRARVLARAGRQLPHAARRATPNGRRARCGCAGCSRAATAAT